MLGRQVRLEDDRPPLHRMRVWQLRDIAKEKGLGEQFGLDLDNMVKDELLEVLGLAKYEPRTKPLGATTTGKVPLDRWAEYGIKLRARELGIPFDAQTSREALTEAIQHVESGGSPPDLKTPIPEEMLVAEKAPPHSVEGLEERPLDGMKIWELKKLAKHLGVVSQNTWKRRDYVNAIKEKRS